MRILTEHTTNTSDGMVRGHVRMLQPYIERVTQVLQDQTYTCPESALVAPSDADTIERVLAYAASKREMLRTVLLVGIGGSDLGTRAVYDALRGHVGQYGVVEGAHLLSFGTVEPGVLESMRAEIAQHKDPREIVLVVVSKSGSTSETIANSNILFEMLVTQYGREAASTQTVVISDEGAPLAQYAVAQGMQHFAIPGPVGGRYSVFTAVGLVPLALLGFDIRALCEGAGSAAKAAVSTSGVSAASVLAALLYDAYLSDIRIHETFLWHPELETLGKWYRQLLAESTGKERTDGTKVGIMPTIAVGSTDLHSLGQLVFGGPNDRFTTFVAAPKTWDTTPGLAEGSPFMIDVLRGKSLGDVMKAIYGGVLATYQSYKLSYVRVEFEQISEREIGSFMATHMAAVTYLANLLDVNAFDQPNVESYKVETRQLLSHTDAE